MSLKNTLVNALHDAMRAKDETTRDTIRVLLSSIKFSEIESGKQLDDNGILTILQKETKIRKETIEELKNSGRGDLIDKARVELKILEKFLPAQLTDAEIEIYAAETIKVVSAKTISDMGKVMGALIPKLAGQAPPDRISQIVKRLLSG